MLHSVKQRLLSWFLKLTEEAIQSSKHAKVPAVSERLSWHQMYMFIYLLFIIYYVLLFIYLLYIYLFLQQTSLLDTIIL